MAGWSHEDFIVQRAFDESEIGFLAEERTEHIGLASHFHGQRITIPLPSDVRCARPKATGIEDEREAKLIGA
jgi:hypothetical protein